MSLFHRYHAQATGLLIRFLLTLKRHGVIPQTFECQVLYPITIVQAFLVLVLVLVPLLELLLGGRISTLNTLRCRVNAACRRLNRNAAFRACVKNSQITNFIQKLVQITLGNKNALDANCEARFLRFPFFTRLFRRPQRGRQNNGGLFKKWDGAPARKVS